MGMGVLPKCMYCTMYVHGACIGGSAVTALGLALQIAVSSQVVLGTKP